MEKITKPQEKRNVRHYHLLEWIKEGRYDREELLKKLNELPSTKKKYSERTLNSDLATLKSEQDAIGKCIKIENRKYILRERNETINLGFDTNETLMLPIIENILSRYQAVPGIEKIIKTIRKSTNASVNDNLFFDNAFTYTSPHYLLKDKDTKAILTLLSFIKNGIVCEFNYSRVNQTREEINLHIVCPLQIRESLGRFYLVAVKYDSLKETNPNKLIVSNYAIDQIHNMRIDPAYDQSLTSQPEPYNFNYSDLVTKVNLKDRFTGSIGICTNYPEHIRPIKFYFADWALSHVIACPLHSSQKIIEYNNYVFVEKLNKKVVVGLIELTIYETFELEFRLASYREYCWVHSRGMDGSEK